MLIIGKHVRRISARSFQIAQPKSQRRTMIARLAKVWGKLDRRVQVGLC
jgi:hypothetical protein